MCVFNVERTSRSRSDLLQGADTRTENLASDLPSLSLFIIIIHIIISRWARHLVEYENHKSTCLMSDVRMYGNYESKHIIIYHFSVTSNKQILLTPFLVTSQGLEVLASVEFKNMVIMFE